MAKLSRSALKGIVKECLVEILNEGILSESQRSPQGLRESSRPTLGLGESNLRSRQAISNTQSQRRPGLDSVSYGKIKDAAPNEKFEKNVKNAVRNLTNDPVLSSIFQDTARTTLQEQRSSAPSTSNTPVPHEAAVLSQGDSAAKTAAMSDPLEMFGEAAGNWAALAFNGSARK